MDKDSVKIIHHLEAQLAVVPKDRIHELVGGKFSRAHGL